MHSKLSRKPCILQDDAEAQSRRWRCIAAAPRFHYDVSGGADSTEADRYRMQNLVNVSERNSVKVKKFGSVLLKLRALLRDPDPKTSEERIQAKRALYRVSRRQPISLIVFNLQSNFFPSLDEAGLMGRAEALVDIGKHPGGAHGIKHPDMGSMSMYHHAMGSTTQSPHNTARSV